MPDKSSFQTEIDFLAALERGEVASQTSLARKISVSVGLMNSLLKRAAQKGYVKAKAAPYRRYVYYLTPKGFAEKSRLVAEYLETSLDFFRRARQEYVVVFVRARASGIRSVVVVGPGELTEIALLAAREAEIEVLGIVDMQANADRLNGLQVVRDFPAPKDVGAVVITESRHPQRVFDHLREIYADEQILAPPLLCITREIPVFMPNGPVRAEP